MPAWGLIPDSPFIYWGRKALRAGRRSRRRSTYAASMSTVITVQKVIINKPVLEFELNSPYGMTGRYMNRMGARILTDAKAEVGVKTGNLRRSITMEHRGIPTKGQTIKIGSALSYAYYHHEGTNPHTIRPKDYPRGVLTFTKGFTVIRAKEVQHPGNRANKFLSRQLLRHVR